MGEGPKMIVIDADSVGDCVDALLEAGQHVVEVATAAIRRAKANGQVRCVHIDARQPPCPAHDSAVGTVGLCRSLLDSPCAG